MLPILFKQDALGTQGAQYTQPELAVSMPTGPATGRLFTMAVYTFSIYGAARAGAGIYGELRVDQPDEALRHGGTVAVVLTETAAQP